MQKNYALDARIQAPDAKKHEAPDAKIQASDAKKSDPSDEGGFDIQYNGISEMKLPN